MTDLDSTEIFMNEWLLHYLGELPLWNWSPKQILFTMFTSGGLLT